MIAERQKRSLVWRLIHLLSSLKLALILIATIAIACAVATITESHFDSAVAKAWIYKAPWFIAWLALLCINLFAVTLSRWPWQKPHTGFIMTHYGIILLLIGAVVGSKLGFEGNVTLRTDGQPQRRIVTDRSCIQVESPADNFLYLLPFDTRFLHPSEKHPILLSVPGTSLKIGIDAVSEHLVVQPHLEPASGKSAGFAVLLNFSTVMMGQSLSVGLGTGKDSPQTNNFFDRATISLASDVRSMPIHDFEMENKKPWLDLAPGVESGRILYRIGRGASQLSSGTLAVGESIPTGWADWRLTLKECGTDRAMVESPAPTKSVPGKGIAEGAPGFRAFLQDADGTRNVAHWVTSGEVVPLPLGNDLVRVGYGLELRPIPFSIALTDFQVPRDEGTETPSDFRASVLFKDSKTGHEKNGFIHMNHPASFPGGFLANLTGLNYKFSQAEWNPQDLRETTLQVLYDPGWLYKWTGSLAIVLGIVTMFYIRPRKQ
jgi:hypothetical protein